MQESKSRKLLFIEDEGYVIARVDELLKGFPNFEVTRTSDADEARRLLKDAAYDVVITDIYVRRASGLELLHKAREKNPGVCGIVITSLENLDLAQKAVKEGAYDFVVKPPGLEKLGSMLKLYSLVKP